MGASLFIKNPPEGFKPEGWEPDTTERSDRSGRDYEFGDAIKTWQWFALWMLLFLNVTAGIAVHLRGRPDDRGDRRRERDRRGEPRGR